MRLLCTCCVINRAFVNAPISQKRKHVKSTLAICKQPKSEEYCFILFSSNNKNGTKYLIKDNISKILTRFVSEGKTTIQFKKPEHDFCIQADIIQLKSFLLLLKRVLENKVSPRDFTVSSMAVTAINTNVVAPKKIVILNRSDYPLKGFARTLEIVQINGIRRCGLDRGILLLKLLRHLDLSDNLIEDLPEELNKLPALVELNLSKNQFGKSAPRKWDWMGGNLSTTLRSLNLSSNNLKFLPDQLVKLHSLITLNVDKNELACLPSGIGNLRHLKILTAAHNNISILPGSARLWCLDELDLSYNKFDETEQNNPAAIYPKPLPVASLKEYAASKVLICRLSYNAQTLPLTVIKYLDLAKYCVCGKACFDYYIWQPQMLFLTRISKSIYLSGEPFVPIDCYFCSLKCFGSSNCNRGRRPCVR